MSTIAPPAPPATPVREGLTPMPYTSLRMERSTWAKWDAALRSGEYRQATGILYQDDPNTEDFGGYCCLGVLQQVVDGRVEHSPAGGGPDIPRPLGMPTMEWARRHFATRSFPGGPFNASGHVPDIAIHDGHRTSAVSANDGLRLSFVQIADLIKACVEFTDGGRP